MKLRDYFYAQVRSVDSVRMLNINNADYVDYVQWILSKMAEDGNSERRFAQ